MNQAEYRQKRTLHLAALEERRQAQAALAVYEQPPAPDTESSTLARDGNLSRSQMMPTPVDEDGGDMFPDSEVESVDAAKEMLLDDKAFPLTEPETTIVQAPSYDETGAEEVMDTNALPVEGDAHPAEGNALPVVDEETIPVSDEK